MNYTKMQTQNEYLGRRVSGIGTAKSLDRLSRLPKGCIANLYRTLVCAPRTESKGDMVSVLWSRYGYDSELWSRVPAEEEFAERARTAKRTDGAA